MASEGHLRLPPILKGDRALEQYTREVQRAFQQVRDRHFAFPDAFHRTSPTCSFVIQVTTDEGNLYQQPAAGGVYKRPGGTDEYNRPPYTVSVCGGNVYSWSFYADSSENAMPGGLTIDVAAASWDDVSADSDHGVWIEATLASPTTNYAPAQATQEQDEFVMDQWVTTQIRLSQRDGIGDYTQGSVADFQTLIGAGTQKSYVYVGRVQISAGGDVTITQKVNEDFMWLHPTFAEDATPPP